MDSHSYTAAELADLLKKQAAERFPKPHAGAEMFHWNTWKRAVEATLEWRASEFLMRQHGPSRPEWRKIDDSCGTPHAIHVTRTELEKEQPLTFWTMYLGEFYECRVYLYPVETPPPATNGSKS